MWLSEVRTAIVGLETTCNTARGVFGPFPVDYVTESLFCHNGKHFCVHHNGSVPEILLLENIILSPTNVSQEPCHSGAVSASSCSWLFLVSMLPPRGQVTQASSPVPGGFSGDPPGMTRSATVCNHCCYVLTPIVWIAHLVLASTLKAYHGTIPDHLVGGD